MTRPPISPRLHALELGELYWEHDRLALRALTPAQRSAQLHARQRLMRHARRVQHLVQTGQIPAGDGHQRAAADGVADLMQMLLEHVRDEESAVIPRPARAARVPIPAPAAIWATPPPPSAPVRAGEAVAEPAAMVCRRCATPLVRDRLAAALNRPMTQGWRHADGRKTHHPDPVVYRS